ncbi:phenylacetate--CoA ligase family protein [Pseudomonas sp. HS6]|uniref:phenylacetate--CoA ligase family protein n=1 Tax=Pseudomonas sp. HS6 TaxID=2850559 RepID=UPI002019DCC8|nr:AMP-binding protein [Pseudomonas sp. HS6]UQS14634.1 phenylacetate--CoA ligase family protein [Pseudomonas sp. HS6]
MSNDPLMDLSAEALAQKLAHARSLPWFRALYPRILEVQTLADLHRLPVLAVEDESGGVLFCTLGEASHRASGGGLTLTSGGSTGNRKQITHSWAFNTAIVPLGARMFGVTDERPGVVINCLTAGEMQGAFQYAAAIAQHVGARLLPAGSQMGVQRVAELIQSHAADALMCTPSFATALFNHANVGAEQLGSLKWLYYIGESCGKGLRDQLAQDWPKLKIRSLGYSSTETGPIGFQCAHLEHGFYHLHADAMLLEVVDPLTLQALAEEQTGEFLLTPLLPDHAPLFRYRIGDRGRILRTITKCACGSSMPVLALEGRVETSIKLGGAIITQRQVLHALRQLLPELDPSDVQVQIDREPGGACLRLAIAEDRLTVVTHTFIEGALQVEGQASALLRLPGVLGLEVKRLARQAFETTLTGKTPFFAELPQTPAKS